MPSRRRFLVGSAALGATGAVASCAPGKDIGGPDAAPPAPRP
ncbi:twin-arginine translocation signal domain-containing protein, partial [Streptomyces phyllanthi]|nr:twin-arginine translocation signal domain-containing protein [Streptomyces phyllanthi]